MRIWKPWRRNLSLLDRRVHQTFFVNKSRVAFLLCSVLIREWETGVHICETCTFSALVSSSSFLLTVHYKTWRVVFIRYGHCDMVWPCEITHIYDWKLIFYVLMSRKLHIYISRTRFLRLRMDCEYPQLKTFRSSIVNQGYKLLRDMACHRPILNSLRDIREDFLKDKTKKF